MGDVRVPYGEDAEEIAIRLLAAAEDLGLERQVVRTQSYNVFLVPEEVAEAADVQYLPAYEPASDEDNARVNAEDDVDPDAPGDVPWEDEDSGDDDKPKPKKKAPAKKTAAKKTSSKG